MILTGEIIDEIFLTGCAAEQCIIADDYTEEDAIIKREEMLQAIRKRFNI